MSESNSSSPKTRHVKCPNCHKPSLFSPENPFRPFCSERCRLIDLGEWAEGNYAVPVGPATAINDMNVDANGLPLNEKSQTPKNSDVFAGGEFALFDPATGLPKQFAESIQNLIPSGMDLEDLDEELAAEIAAQLMSIASRSAPQSDDNE